MSKQEGGTNWVAVLLFILIVMLGGFWLIEQMDREAAREKRATDALHRLIGGR